MAIYGNYARYYNLLYRDKDYAAESAFVLGILKKYGASPHSLLDLGCGTGRHALETCGAGIQVTGVDLSETMLEMGRRKLAQLKQGGAETLPDLVHGDVRTVRLERKFDAVTSLFHVMSYQNSEQDAIAMFETAKCHLVKNGLFFFDFWYGPGVLTDPPAERDKKLEDDAVIIARHAHPVHKVNDNIVEVHYDVRIHDKKTGLEESLNEMHPMRYWFLPELRCFAKTAGFDVVAEGVWMSEEIPEKDTWNAWMLVRC